MSPDIRDQKRHLRREMLARRAALQADNPDAAYALRDQFLKHISLPPDGIVSAYIAVGSEMDTAPLIAALRERGHRIALPVVTGKGLPLIFRLYETGDALATNAMGLSEPLDAAPPVEPDIILAPMLAFDMRKYRLGYGGGYYDRTLALLRPRKKMIAIGIGYAGQGVPIVPVGSYDVPMDGIVIETQVIG